MNPSGIFICCVICYWKSTQKKFKQFTIIHRSGGEIPSLLGKYPPLSPTVRWIIVLVYTTQAEKLADQRVTLFVTIYRQKPFLFFFGCPQVNSTWLITSELANQCARKVLFTCVVYTNLSYFPERHPEFYHLTSEPLNLSFTGKLSGLFKSCKVYLRLYRSPPYPPKNKNKNKPKCQCPCSFGWFARRTQ